MDQIAEMRRQKMLEYKMNVWLPQITEKYKRFFDPKRLAGIKIAKFCKKYLLVPVVNMTEDEMYYIPGIFRMRLRLTNKNKEKPVSPLIKSSSPSIVKNMSDEDDSYNQMNDYINMHNDIHYGNNEDNMNVDDMDNSLKLAIQKSLSTVNGVDDVDIDEIINKSKKEHDIAEDETLAKIMEETATDHFQDYPMDYIPDGAFVDFVPNTESKADVDSEDELEAAIQLSMQKHDEKDNISNDEESFFACIDLRVFGPEPYQPLYVDGIEYHLNNDQINKVKKVWHMINPDTDNGLKYSQDLAYQMSLAKDTQLF